MLKIGTFVKNISNSKKGIIIENDRIKFSNIHREKQKINLIYCVKYKDNTIDFVLERFLQKIN